MADRMTPEQRARTMARVKGKDTKPEMRVRRALHAAGFRYRLHDKRLPGRPDLVLPRLSTAVFVHGCFWHGHDCPKGRRRPASNTEFWNAKLDRNKARDAAAVAALVAAGRHVETIWECRLDADLEAVIARLRARRAATDP